jgi:hypothetical protein
MSIGNNDKEENFVTGMSVNSELVAKDERART